MYKNIKSFNNNTKESDIIKTLEKMIVFAGGMGMGIMYQKYQKDVVNYIKRVVRDM